MAKFKASKERKPRPKERLGRGSPINVNAGIEAWYRKELQKVANAMIRDYAKELGSVLKEPVVSEYFAMDGIRAPVANILARLLGRLNRIWGKVFKDLAESIAPEFVDKTESAATSAVLYSLKVAGLEAPRSEYDKNVRNTLKGFSELNLTLITDINFEMHKRIYEAVMLSLTSPNPDEQGIQGIQNALRATKEFSEKRISLIARDQTSKIYSSLSDERMRQNGVEEFIWQHSSAGKVPRQDHLNKDGEKFKLDDPRLWQGKKADQGPPGWAINCRCRRIPVI